MIKKYNHDDAKYITIRDVENLFHQSTDKDYYKPISLSSTLTTVSCGHI